MLDEDRIEVVPENIALHHEPQDQRVPTAERRRDPLHGVAERDQEGHSDK